MALSSMINSTRIEMFTEENYDTWQIQVEALLIKNDTWSFVDGSNEKPTISGVDDNERATAQRAINSWTKQDRKAKSDLILAISPTILKHIQNCETSKDVWEKLKTTFAS